MQNPNPLYFDEAYAAESRFGPDRGPPVLRGLHRHSHGAGPAIQGHPGQHMIFGGDEWWFFGPRLEPGDLITHERMLFDYKVTETKFSGPTMFSRGDTSYINQRGEAGVQAALHLGALPGRERAKTRHVQGQRAADLEDQELEDLEKQKLEYYQSFLDLGHEKRLFVKVGDKLPQRPIGPHSIASFTTEWRAFLMTVWGPPRVRRALLARAGWLPEMSRDLEGAKIDPPSPTASTRAPRAATCRRAIAQLIGMPRELRLRRLDGRLDPRLPRELGGRVGLDPAQQHAVSARPRSPAT
jgi:hypothetical protein